MSSLETTVKDFKEYLDKIVAFSHLLYLAHYDAFTSMPSGARESWSKKFALAGSEILRLRTSDEMGAFLDKLSMCESELDEVTAATVRYLNRDYKKYKRIPAEFSREKFEAEGEASLAWEKAKSTNDFKTFAPYLQKNIELCKRYALLLEPDKNPFDTLLDESEPGMTSDVLDVYFAKLREKIVPLLKKVMASTKKIEQGFMSRNVPVEQQVKISELMMREIGYDTNHGQLRETEHPFCSSFGKFDSRISTHYHEDNFMSSVFSVLHECGHAMYELNKADRIANTVLDSGASAAMHESQSRFYENSVGRSREFIYHFFDELKTLLGADFDDLTPEQLFEASNAAQPGLIRIEADELTYSLHIMVRYEIEKLFVTSDIDVNELPRIWNEKMKGYLGVDVPDDSRGVLQDVHWSQGMIGYFPSYSLGSAYGAQLLHSMRKDIAFEAEVAKGNVAAVSGWLTEKLQQYGSMYLPQELLVMATGEPFNPDYYIDYLEKKFSQLYLL